MAWKVTGVGLEVEVRSSIGDGEGHMFWFRSWPSCHVTLSHVTLDKFFKTPFSSENGDNKAPISQGYCQY